MTLTEELLQDIKDSLSEAVVCSLKVGRADEKEHLMDNLRGLTNHLSSANARAQQLYGIMYNEWKEGLK